MASAASPPRAGAPAPGGAGASADVAIRAAPDKKATVSSRRAGLFNSFPTRWPQSREEWRSALAGALPWALGVAVAAVVTAAAVNRRCEADNPGSALDDAGESAKRGWFGLKRKASNAADSAVDAAVRAKRKAAGGAKDAVKETGWWAAEKAHDAADATKGAARATAGAAKGAAHKVEETIAGTGSAALAAAGAGEERLGRAAKEAGDKVERDGRSTKQFFRGEEAKAEVAAKKKGWFGLW